MSDRETNRLIPLVDLPALHQRVARAAEEQVQQVLRSGHYIGGPVVTELEEVLADRESIENAVGVANGTDAIALILKALGIGPGDEVVIPAVSFFATAGAVLHTGATPVVVDVLADRPLMDPEAAQAACTERTRAIVPVHLFGMAAPIPMTRHAVVSDAAQAVAGTPSRCQGVASAVSFYPTKVLGGAGDGGMVLTNDTQLAHAVRRLANHGAQGSHLHGQVNGHVGGNSRLDAIQAAILLAHLADLDDRLARRRLIARHFMERFGPLAVQHAPGSPVSIFCLRHPQRDALAKRLQSHGVGTAVYYPRPLTKQPALAAYPTAATAQVPNANRFCEEALAIPCRATLSDEQVEQIASAVEECA